MISIEHANENHVVEMHNLLQSQLDQPDSLSVISLCVENYPAYVATDDISGVVGVAYTLGIGSDLLLLHGLHVHNQFRDNEIGSKLLKITEDKARTLGYCTIVLTNSMQYSGAGKRSAVPFYDKHGYRQVHQTFNSPPTFLMLKEL